MMAESEQTILSNAEKDINSWIHLIDSPISDDIKYPDYYYKNNKDLYANDDVGYDIYEDHKWDDTFCLSKKVSKFYESGFNKVKEDYKKKLECEIDPIEKQNIKYEIESIDFSIDQFHDITYVTKIIKRLKLLYKNDKIQVDKKLNLIAFESNVYDITKHEFRAIRILDKISKSTGYDIKDRNEESICALRNLILPEGKLLEHVLSIYARCLCRNTPEYFRVMTGKSPLDELIKYAFGEYGNIPPQTAINQVTDTFTFTDDINS